MKYLFIILFLSSVHLFAMSSISKSGEELYLDAKCQKCHKKGASFDNKKKKLRIYLNYKVGFQVVLDFLI